MSHKVLNSKYVSHEEKYLISFLSVDFRSDLISVIIFYNTLDVMKTTEINAYTFTNLWGENMFNIYSLQPLKLRK